MTRKLLLPLALVGVTALGAAAATGIAGEDTSAPQASSLSGGFGAVESGIHRVAKPSGGAGAASVTAAAKKAKKPKIQYFETEAFPIDAGEGLGDTLPCPGKRRVLTGYFGADSIDVAETFAAPESNKSWFEGITNFGMDNDVPAFIGIVCAKGVK